MRRTAIGALALLAATGALAQVGDPEPATPFGVEQAPGGEPYPSSFGEPFPEQLPQTLVLPEVPPAPTPAPAPIADEVAPTVILDFPPGASAPGTFSVTASVSDRSGVGNVILRARLNRGEFGNTPMREVGDGRWLGTLQVPREARNVEFYVVAFDALGNGPTQIGSPELPYKISTDREREAAVAGGATKYVVAIGLIGAVWLVSLLLRRESEAPVRVSPSMRAKTAAARRRGPPTPGTTKKSGTDARPRG